MVNEGISDNTDIYRALQKHLDKMPIGYPRVDSGADIRLLKHLFSPEEAKIALFLKFGWDRDLEPLETIYERAKETGISQNELEEILDKMVSRGSIMFKRDKGKKYYGNALLMVGMFEFQVNNLTEEFIKDFHDYFEEGWLLEAFRVKGSQLRIVPVEESIEFEELSTNYDDIIALIESADDPIMVSNCICKQLKDIMKDPCKTTDRREVCMAFGVPAQLYIDQERGRPITKREAIEILRKNQEDGLVIQPDNSQKLSFVCSCCSCCCESLSKVVSFPNPARVLITNYYANVDSELCTGCGTCVEICQMGSISLNDDVLHIEPIRCIGCGNCVIHCSSEAIKLLKREKQFKPYPTMDILFDKIMERKIKLQQQSSK
ncbi:MAG: 4Fe-4S binding protein [Candidatus Thorarchaeota archaeon]